MKRRLALLYSCKIQVHSPLFRPFSVSLAVRFCLQDRFDLYRGIHWQLICPHGSSGVHSILSENIIQELGCGICYNMLLVKTHDAVNEYLDFENLPDLIQIPQSMLQCCQQIKGAQLCGLLCLFQRNILADFTTIS